MEGYLMKRGDKGVIKSWKKRFFCLKDNYFSYYEKEGSPELGKIDLRQSISIHQTSSAHNLGSECCYFQIDTPVRYLFFFK